MDLAANTKVGKGINGREAEGEAYLNRVAKTHNPPTTHFVTGVKSGHPQSVGTFNRSVGGTHLPFARAIALDLVVIHDQDLPVHMARPVRPENSAENVDSAASVNT